MSLSIRCGTGNYPTLNDILGLACGFTHNIIMCKLSVRIAHYDTSGMIISYTIPRFLQITNSSFILSPTG